MIKRDLLRRHSRHTALLMAVTLACTNTGMAVNTVYAQETGSEAGSGENGGGGGSNERKLQRLPRWF